MMMKRKLDRFCCYMLIGLMFIIGVNEFSPCEAQEIRIDEKTTTDNVKALLSSSKILGLVPGEKNWVEIDLQTAALQALEKNLSIMRSALGKEIAELAIQETRALFDPLFAFSITYSGTYTYERTEQDQKWKQSTDSNDQVTYDPPSPIAYLQFDQPRPEGYYQTNITASEEPVTGPDTSMTYAVSLFQHIPWGSDLIVSLTTVDKEAYWVNDDKSYGSYNRPWKSTVSETLTIPLPWCRNFGRFAANDVQLRLSRLSDEQTYWNVKAVINDTLLQTDIAYWTLVSEVMSLSAVNRHQKKIELLLNNTQTLYDERMATEYDLSQVKLELATIRERQQTATNRVILASNVLIQLMDADKNAVFLPAGYKSLLESEADDFAAMNFTKDLQDNPELKTQSFRIKIAELSLNQSRSQARPDLNLTQRMTFSQSSSSYGLSTAWDSLSEVFASPDLIRQNYSVNYRYPLFNRSVKSNLEMAQLNKEIEKVLQDNLKNQITREINNAQAALAAAQARLKITENNLKLAQLAYDKAVNMQKDREISEYEIVNKSSDLLDAEQAFIQARIEQKKAEARLLAALGRLPERFAQQTAQNELYRNQLDLLERNNLLHYFKEKTS
jgi:outer membrane protein TolC